MGKEQKSVYTILAEIQNQLKFIRGAVYGFAENETENPHPDTSDELEKPIDAFLGIYNTLQDIDMKLKVVLGNDELDKIPVPGIVGKW